MQFEEFLSARLNEGGFTTEDALAAFLPLARQTIEAHAAGQVAPLEGLVDLRVENGRIWFEDAHRRPPRSADKRVRVLDRPSRTAVEIMGKQRRTTDVASGADLTENLQIGSRDAEPNRPVYLPGYVAWEHALEHHDPSTDVFSLGLILASLACGLDLRDEDRLRAFVDNRGNLFGLNPGLHPVLAKAIVRMTELSRHRRPQDLALLVRNLENYRDQDIDFEYELGKVADFEQCDLPGKQQAVLTALRQRLFEISRRNRLLHFQATQETVDLTQASVPLVMQVENIRPDHLVTWGGPFKDDLIAGKPISLNRYADFREVLYLGPTLDRIRAAAIRDRAEFGFEQLRLVLCFLRWTDLKESPPQRYDSPLALVPVKMTKKKGVRDTYYIEAASDEIEINPVVRHLYAQLYNIALPERVDLSARALDDLHEAMATQIAASEPAVNLEKITRPRIDLLHDSARRRLDQYIQRARLAGRGVRRNRDFDYSYDPANFHPLGLRLFNSLVRTPELNLRAIIEQCPRPRHFYQEPDEAPAAEKSQQFYSLRRDNGNPYAWEFDLCQVTLGNFHYRKMTLVRDYNELLEEHKSNPAFEAVFQLEPRPLVSQDGGAGPLDERFDVLPADSTQAAAIRFAREGQSYIIQGPPGTGKSQTITNLIADFLARGRRVLFVCEKRAAIDVVHARLRQMGLDSLCCLIHDSQTDKKEFVMDLKRTYEAFGAEADLPADGWREKRRRLVDLMRRELAPLEKFGEAMQTVPETLGVAVAQAIQRVAELSDRAGDDVDADVKLPPYRLWVDSRAAIDRLAEVAMDVCAGGVLAAHPLRRVNPGVAHAQDPVRMLADRLTVARQALGELRNALAFAQVPSAWTVDLGAAEQAIRYGELGSWFADRDAWGVLDEQTPAGRRFVELLGESEQRTETLAECRGKTQAWREKLDADETATALDQARRLDHGLLRYFRPGWWRLRKVLHRCYDFTTHRIRPSWEQVLQTLKAEHNAVVALAETHGRFTVELRLKGEPTDLPQRTREFRELLGRVPEPAGQYHSRLLSASDSGEQLRRLAGARDAHLRLVRACGELLRGDVDNLALEELDEELDRIASGAGDLLGFLECLAEIRSLPAELAEALMTVRAVPAALERAVARRSLDTVLRSDRRLWSFSAAVRRRQADRVEACQINWRQANAAAVREQTRSRFIEHLRIASAPAAQLSEDQKDLKARYNRGRRELEHEFGKVMRYRPIRELFSGDSGLVVNDLKPVWLMSPLSVSDTLPLAESAFDVVIFDEASQITLEEAIPSLFRARQAIVVGDEMQLPPTNFFSAKSADEDALRLEEDGEAVEYDLAANSFLSHAARHLPSRMLGWHYRSRSESLISFSNWAFYSGGLLTVPDERITDRTRDPIIALDPTEGQEYVDDLLDRPLSFHFMDGGVYRKRRNRMEAEYIAEMVRELLRRDEGLSIGIVAFSEAQQEQIETALNDLAAQDREFRGLLDAELEREEDGQFVGLLVRNLENIQGDERDVVIMSVCYGYGEDGRMRMNFGPINQSGGEKRLNVAFSRAKHRMALVSSIHDADITNDYNDGANCLKTYLRYAAAVSEGDTTAAQRALRDLAVWRDTRDDGYVACPVAVDIACRLRRCGWRVDLGVGMSQFRCDLAVSADDDETYRLGVLVDGPAYYAQRDLLERDVMRPTLLETFGWKVAFVLSSDWHTRSEEILAGLLARLEGAVDEEPVEEDNEDGLAADIAKAMAAPRPVRQFPRAASTPSNQGSLQPPPVPANTACVDLQPGRPCYLELANERSSKFWEITLSGAAFSVRFGRIGTSGQERTKSFRHEAAARSAASTLLRQKLAKGYSPPKM